MSSNPDSFSPEARNPFFVPDKTEEAIGFATAAAIALMLPVALLTIALDTITVAIFAVGVLLPLFTGLQRRRYRLRRVREVAELWNKIDPR